MPRRVCVCLVQHLHCAFAGVITGSCQAVVTAVLLRRVTLRFLHQCAVVYTSALWGVCCHPAQQPLRNHAVRPHVTLLSLVGLTRGQQQK